MRFEFSGTRELYIEIADKYKSYIGSNVMREGEKLPSVRQAALELGVNPNTVARAYSLLESEGYIRSIPKKGVYVSDAYRGEEKIEESKAATTDSLREEIAALLASGMSKEELIRLIEDTASLLENGKGGDSK